eukprot:CAMPEP_0181501676 /NCGR_PEP_ID=MMETSP1110-20121109/55925_1 /TAXON_ID=174948 /ORGANISM="Symbiodinium sp., Strain CCMP421" /LENGTH=78 /DNA_ID=CAMNT_0023630157 /DNA_START=17 /DNA_END=253 /DNA_ORIENTATION=-
MMSIKPPTMLPFRKNAWQGHDVLGRDSIFMPLVVQVHVVQAARLNDVDLLRIRTCDKRILPWDRRALSHRLMADEPMQ